MDNQVIYQQMVETKSFQEFKHGMTITVTQFRVCVLGSTQIEGADAMVLRKVLSQFTRIQNILKIFFFFR